MALVQIFVRINHIISVWIIFLLLLSFLLSPVLPEIIYRVDPLALLSATLRTYQRAGCDSEQLSLSCPRGTSISIELAQYGRAGDFTENNLCPPASDDTTTLLEGVLHSGTEIEVRAPESCTWPNALQYSLLQTVVEACQKKRHCKFTAIPKSFAGDPCPGIRKFVEIAYKCRPYEFRSKVACENDMMMLVCNPYSRIAVYSASFGRTEYDSVQCSQTDGVKEEKQNFTACLVSYATETVMQICHGRRRCTLSADSSTFGRPCKADVRMFLKVVYTCVPRKVLKDRYDTSPEPDEPQQSDLDIDQDDLYDEDQFYKESEAIPPAPKLQGGLSNPSHSNDFLPGEIPSSLMPPILSRNDNNLEENQERFYLYLIISVTAGVVLCLVLVIGRFVIHKRRTKPETKFSQSNTGETQLPNGFSDDISEIDADIDLTTPLPVPSVSRNENYMTYAPSSNPYGTLGPSNVSHTSTTMLVPSTGLMGSVGGQQTLHQQPTMMGTASGLMGPPVSGPMGALIPISSVSHHTTAPSYITGSLMVTHHGTLRRPMIPTSCGVVVSSPAPSPLGGPVPNVNYDGAMQRTLSRGLTDNSQYYYG